MVGMFFQTMYNVVDTWTAGKLSIEALAGLTASFPVFFLVIAVAHGCQAATNALVSQALGAEQEKTVCRLSMQALVFAAWMSVLIGIIGYVVAPDILRWMHVTGETLQLSVSYIRTLFWATPFFVFASTLHAMMSAHGETRPFRNSLIAGFVLNILFDLWFVFGGAGLPPMGFAGIARATVLIQGLVMVYMILKAVQHQALHVRSIRDFIPDLKIQFQYLMLGFPAFLNLLTIAAGIFVYNSFAANVSTEVLAAFGVAMRIEQIALLPAIGLNTAAMTLAGHCLGAKRLDRLREILFACLRFGLWIFFLGAPLVALFARFWITRFNQDPAVVESGVVLLRISMLTFYAYVIVFVLTSMLQGLQKPFFAVWMGLYRQIAAPLFLIPLLMHHLTPPELGIWWGAFFSVWSGVILTIVYSLWVYKKLQKKWNFDSP